LHPTAPFDFDLALGSFASFAAPGPGGVERYTRGHFSRVLRAGERLYHVQLRDAGAVEAPQVEITLWPKPPAQDADELTGICAWMMAADLDTTPLHERAAARDPALHRVLDRLRGFRQPRTPDPFEALITAITEQLTSIKTAATLRARLVERYGESLQVDQERWLAFPTPAALAAAEPDDIRALGLLGMKAQCIVSIARAVAEGSLGLAGLATAPLTEVTQTLKAIKGIGPWTIAYVLGRGFGRYQLVPEGDIALRAAVAAHYGRAAATDRDVREALAPYTGWQGLAAFALILDYAMGRYRVLQPTLPL
jgi:DNA-3-methyladenine glycosylase II